MGLKSLIVFGLCGLVFDEGEGLYVVLGSLNGVI